MKTSSIPHLHVFLLMEIVVITCGKYTSYYSSSGLPQNLMALASSHLSTPSDHPATSTVVSNSSNTEISLTEKLMSSTALLLTSSDFKYSSLNDMPMMSDSALLLSRIMQASPVLATSSITATTRVNATSSITATFPVNVTSSIAATSPVNATSSIAATFPVNATSSIASTFTVNATCSISATSPVNATSSIAATSPVNATSSIATSPVNATSSITATSTVNATSSITATSSILTTPSSFVTVTPTITAKSSVLATSFITATFSVLAPSSITTTSTVLITSSSFVSVPSFNTTSSSVTAIPQAFSTNHISNAYISSSSAAGKTYSTILPTATIVLLSDDISLISSAENVISTETSLPSITDMSDRILPSANKAYSISLSRFNTVSNYHSTSSGNIFSSIDTHIPKSTITAKYVSTDDATFSVFLASSTRVVSFVNAANTPIQSAIQHVLSLTEEKQTTDLASPSAIRLSPSNVNANIPVTTLNPFRSVGNIMKMSVSNGFITLIINFVVLNTFIVG